MEQPAWAPAAWRTASVGVGRNPVEAEWGTTGGGFTSCNCSSMTTQRECDLHTGTKGSCRWEGGKCASVFEAATALSYLADLVRGFWFSTQRGGENVSWRVLRKSVFNASCVNAAVNAVVDRAGAAACRHARRCPGSGHFPRDGALPAERDCKFQRHSVGNICTVSA